MLAPPKFLSYVPLPRLSHYGPWSLSRRRREYGPAFRPGPFSWTVRYSLPGHELSMAPGRSPSSAASRAPRSGRAPAAGQNSSRSSRLSRRTRQELLMAPGRSPGGAASRAPHSDQAPVVGPAPLSPGAESGRWRRCGEASRPPPPPPPRPGP